MGSRRGRQQQRESARVRNEEDEKRRRLGKNKGFLLIVLEKWKSESEEKTKELGFSIDCAGKVGEIENKSGKENCLGIF
jgi:hypothetical protein